MAPETQNAPQPNQSFRVDVQLHDLLVNKSGRPKSLLPTPGQPLILPDPVYPSRPELANIPDVQSFPDKRSWPANLVYRAMRGWLFPYMRSRVLPGDFHPIIAYLFTEWKCNLDCHYCWAFDNRVKGMTEDVARRSIDWLHDHGCRVLALMGGEPLLRPPFVHKVVYYAAKKGFWIYVPTNGRLLRPDVIDRLGDAGVATFNLAVDALDIKPGLPKALAPIRAHFDHLVKRQYRYGYTVFFNMNICRNNMDDIRGLTEIAREHRIATDYHINEPPMLEPEHFEHLHDNVTYIHKENWPEVDKLVDWLIEKNKSGYKMVNSVQRLNEMREFMRGKLQDWNCRAGHNNVIVRVDGSLAPCFPMYSATYDWGVAGDHKFDKKQLEEMKQGCQPHCFSTLNHNLAYCYDATRVVKWLGKQAAHGFQGASGSFT
ncbi:MAG TPA: radical SAM protein [Bryobacteraceae bacterium]|nr:radical SAM protein [Bryobacteraceae bacterium]